MKWFGPYSWGAEICDQAERVGVPAGSRCQDCGEVIYPHDRGFVLPYMPPDMSEQKEEPWHFRCLMRNTLGPDWASMAPGLEP